VKDESKEIVKYNSWLESERKKIAEQELLSNFAVARSRIEGQGLFVRQNFKPGEIVSQYPIGEHEDLRTAEEIDPDSDFAHDSIQYGVNEQGEALYLSVPADNPRRFLNHSCDPNSILRIGRKEGGLVYSDIVPLRDLKKDEELTIDYGTTQLDDWEMECNCGSPNCRHKMTDFKQLPEDRKKLYLSVGAIPEWMKRELEKTGNK